MLSVLFKYFYIAIGDNYRRRKFSFIGRSIFVDFEKLLTTLKKSAFFRSHTNTRKHSIALRCPLPLTHSHKHSHAHTHMLSLATSANVKTDPAQVHSKVDKCKTLEGPTLHVHVLTRTLTHHAHAHSHTHTLLTHMNQASQVCIVPRMHTFPRKRRHKNVNFLRCVKAIPK